MTEPRRTWAPAEVTNVQHCQFVWDYASRPLWEEEEARGESEQGRSGRLRVARRGCVDSQIRAPAVWGRVTGGGWKGHWPLTLCIIRPMDWEEREGPSLWRGGRRTSGPRRWTIHPRVDKKQLERTRPRADNWDNHVLWIMSLWTN